MTGIGAAGQVHNELTGLCEELFRLPSLAMLKLDYNKIPEIPPAIERVGSAPGPRCLGAVDASLSWADGDGKHAWAGPAWLTRSREGLRLACLAGQARAAGLSWPYLSRSGVGSV